MAIFSKVIIENFGGGKEEEEEEEQLEASSASVATTISTPSHVNRTIFTRAANAIAPANATTEKMSC